MFAEDEPDSGEKTSPGIPLRTIGRPTVLTNGKHEHEQGERANCVQNIDEGKSKMRNQQAAGGRSDYRSNLEKAAVPGDGIGKGVARNQGRKKRAARRPGERPKCAVNEEQPIDDRDGSVIEVKGRLMPFENSGD